MTACLPMYVLEHRTVARTGPALHPKGRSSRSISTRIRGNPGLAQRTVTATPRPMDRTACSDSRERP